nr:integrase, catalytic region, zinc finger, CCHC-type, peptidase aspartic, catalytic [Tanacetum cinerariifolium]
MFQTLHLLFMSNTGCTDRPLGLVRGLPKLKYEKDHLCSACSFRKSRKHTHKPKSENSIQEKLYLLHMDLCGPMLVESINGKKYILFIVNDYSRLSHYNFDTINELAKQGLVRGLPKLKYEKDHLCSACSFRKSRKHTHKPKSENSIQEKLYLLHMDLCGPMLVESINGKKYILFIVNDYSRTSFEESLSRDVIPLNLHPANQPFKHLSIWTKNLSLNNVIGNPSRPVSTRRQLQTDAIWCYFDAFLTSDEPKNYKEALKKSCWIKAMHEEIHEFERLQV